MTMRRKRAEGSGKRPASRTAGVRSEFMPEMGADEVAFVHAIADEPGDDTPRLAYADWLDEHDQPARAEFIRIQCELARYPTDRFGVPIDSLPQNLREREWELLDQWGGPWLAELQQRPHSDLASRRDWAAENRASPKVRHPLAEHGFTNWHYFNRGFLTKICPLGETFWPSNRGWLSSPLLRLVTEIYSHNSGISGSDIALLAASDVVTGVKKLVLSNNHVGDQGAMAIATSQTLSELTILRLGGNSIGDTGAFALAHSDSLGRLEYLCLSSNRIGDRGARAFLATRTRSLKVLTLHHATVSEPVAADLMALAETPGGVRVEM